MSESIVDEYLIVRLLGSGFAAVHMVKVKDGNDTYWDVQQTGVGRYKTSKEAEIEAKSWSASDEIRLVK